jgi:GT2 family glycosyltransferase
MRNISMAIGVVLYRTRHEDAKRLVRSCGVAAEEVRDAQTQLLMIDNSGEIPGSTGNFVSSQLRITHVRSHGNIGFGAAHNRLMEQAFAGGCTHYIAVNPDGFLHPLALSRMLRESKRLEDFALVEARQFPNEHPKMYHPESFETPWCSGACLMIPETLYERIGGFDGGFFLYCEDVDLSWRARLAGGTCLVAADAYFFHDVLDRPARPEVRWHMALSMRRLLSKWGSPSDLLSWHRRLDRMLEGATAEVLALGSKPVSSDAVMRSHRSDVPDFTRKFGFAAMRW